MADSLIIPFPSAPVVQNEKNASNTERVNMYDIIMKIFTYKYTYEKATEFGKQDEYKNMNLKNIKVYNSILNEINFKISDPFIRDFVIKTLVNIKNNDYSKESVKITYETVKEWFCTDSLKGKIFRNNLASGVSYVSINFKALFEMCNTMAITPDSPLFDEVKKYYQKFSEAYSDLFM